MEEDYITLNEIYISNPKLFTTKSLKSFIRNHKIQDINMVTKGNKILGIKKSWIKKNIGSFNLKLETLNDKNSVNFFEVIPTLEKYIPKIKTFNPINLNLDSTMVKYFACEGKRIPYFTKKGLIKIKILFNDVENQTYEWFSELINGKLQPYINNIENVIEMVNSNHPLIIKNINGNMTLSNHIYNIDNDDIILDFKRLADLKKETNLKIVAEDYKCPLYSQLQTNFIKKLKEVETNFNIQIKELKQEKVIEHLKQELDKEKSLKDQVLSLTQSFNPFGITTTNGDVKPSLSPCIPVQNKHNSPISKTLSSLGKLKPSKIK
jgi:uncharacterized protein (DUF2249 family)